MRPRESRGKIDDRRMMGGDEIEANTVKAKRNKKKFAKKSPSILNRVHVKGSTYMVPKVKLETPEQVEEWRQKMVEKYGL
jgi:hypothetical protein